MQDPIKISGTGNTDLEVSLATLKHQLELSGTIPNVDSRLGELEGILADTRLALVQSRGAADLLRLEQDVTDQLFVLRNIEEHMILIEQRLGSGSSEPVDLTLQQTLDVLHQIRQLDTKMPGDERLASMATNVSEGLEAFVTATLAGVGSSSDDETAIDDSPNPADLVLTLEVIEAIKSCPGRDRSSIYKSLRQQFVDVACYAAWKRLDRLADQRLTKASRKQYLHEALTIWMILPDLSENAGTPRLSLLPREMHNAIQQLFLKHVIGEVVVGNPKRLVEDALLTKELTEEYLGMIPTLEPEAQAAMVNQAINSLIRRTRTEISIVDSWQGLETCLAAMSILGTTTPTGTSLNLTGKLAWPIRRAQWRLRMTTVIRRSRRYALPFALTVTTLALLMGAYVGIAYLVESIYQIDVPLGPVTTSGQVE